MRLKVGSSFKGISCRCSGFKLGADQSSKGRKWGRLPTSLPEIFLEHLLLRASLRVGSWGPIKKQRGVISAIKEMRTDSGVTYLVWRFREGVLEEVDSQKGSTG